MHLDAQRLSAATGARAILEIGTGVGVSGLALLRYAPEAHLTSIEIEPEYLRQAAIDSARRLGVESIGLYQYHRQDYTVAYTDSLGAMKDLLDEGLIQMAGISNAITEQIALFDEILDGRLVSVQNRFSPIFQSSRPELDYTVEHGMAFLPWSPLGGIGNGSEVFDSSAFAAVGAELGVSAQQVALAWELSLGDSVIPIPGASRPASAADSALAPELVLTPEQLARLGA